MSVPILKVLDPGLFSTIQDLGRVKFRKFGITTNGAMDNFALRIGNRLVGNKQGEAGIELTLMGGEYLIMQDCIISITGGNLNPQIDGENIPMWESLFLRKDSKLSFNNFGKGMRSYLCIQGGIDVPDVLGSKSTNLKAGFGGYNGSTLKSGDTIYKKDGTLDMSYVGNNFPSGIISEYYSWALPVLNIRILLGPELDYFTKKGINTFLNGEYTISTQADRMGYQLEGPKIEHSDKGSNVITNATPSGVIQVPGEGIPIILLRDNQTTGGYPKIATVITSDIGILVQRTTWDKIKFTEVDIEKAYQLYKQIEGIIDLTPLKLGNR
jgi:antagonist of KipI